jgi:hypothetical protein
VLSACRWFRQHQFQPCGGDGGSQEITPVVCIHVSLNCWPQKTRFNVSGADG